MSHVFYRKLDHALPTVVRASGVFVYDSSGKRYLDGCGGAMVCNVGHGVEEIAAAIGAQARTVAYVNGTAFTNEPAEELAAMLAERSPAGLDKAYFLCSGSEAVEASLKLARQYHVERGDEKRRIIIARTPGYHGNTLLALSASAREHYRQIFAPWLLDVAMIDAPYPYRAGALGDRSPAMTGEALETAILRLGPENVAAFIAEPIGGSSTGASLPPRGYYARVRDICDRHGVLFIADEVLTGAGRTGRFFALEHFRASGGEPISPDIIAMGKGLNGGYAPLSAMIVRSGIIETIARGSGRFLHAQTYSHNPLGCAAAVATLRYIDKHGLVARAGSMGARMQGALAAVAQRGDGADIVGDVRGCGMLAAVELVADRETKRPFSRSLKVAETLVAKALERGLILWPNVGQADGINGDLVMIAPPFTISSEELDELIILLQAAIADTAAALKMEQPL
ncbi:MAG: aspartate aminotransferase family protein [Candidatus Eremiobacteraeota bacterium]|nr:aspartate aminotransferase family protein [Candidatus Eremiobacteraeota bacterium]MBC5828323.1 aspartate aminotransferase family protein [Candidatus Eremiobacteraeota bacterium]